jgi:hypothetical protein
VLKTGKEAEKKKGMYLSDFTSGDHKLFAVQFAFFSGHYPACGHQLA